MSLSHPKLSNLTSSLDSDHLLLLAYDRQRTISRFSQHNSSTSSGGRKSRNPFFMFLRDFRALNSGLSATEVISRGAREWRRSSAEVKLSYYKESARVKRRPRRSRRRRKASPPAEKGEQGQASTSDQSDNDQNQTRQQRKPTPSYISWKSQPAEK